MTGTHRYRPELTEEKATRRQGRKQGAGMEPPAGLGLVPPSTRATVPANLQADFKSALSEIASAAAGVILPGRHPRPLRSTLLRHSGFQRQGRLDESSDNALRMTRRIC